MVDENNLTDDDINLNFPTSDVSERTNWTEQLQALFPDVPRLNIESSVNLSESLQEAADLVLCDETNVQVEPKKDEETLSDLHITLAAKIQDSEYVLTVERDEVHTSFAFYKSYPYFYLHFTKKLYLIEKSYGKT